MTKPYTVPFGEWLPSAPTFKNPGCEVADNVIPTAGGSYGPLASLTASSDSASAVVTGAEQMFTNSGTNVIVGGTRTSLFIRTSSLTETGGLSDIGAGQAWDFARFNDFVFATGENNNLKYLSDINTDTSWSDSPGSPPQAKFCDKVGEFLILGNLSGQPNWIQWSPYNNPTGAWGTNRLTQAGKSPLDSKFGAVQRVVGGRYATVFQERGIQRLSYVGPPVVWRADVIEPDRGCVAPYSVAQLGHLNYFLAQDGFYVTNGSVVQPIGTNRVNKWFFDNVNQASITRVQAAIDWQNETIVWGFIGSGATTYNRLIMYSWAQQRWSTGTISVDWLVGSKLDGIDLDSLDAIYGDLDNIPVSLDSDIFKDGDRRLAAFVDGTYNTFTGTPLRAVWETGEAQPSPGQRVFVDEVYPLIEAEAWDIQIELLMRDNRGIRTVSAPKTTGWSGFAPVRGEGQKLAIRMTKPAGTVWSGAQGVQPSYQPAGYR